MARERSHLPNILLGNIFIIDVISIGATFCRESAKAFSKSFSNSDKMLWLVELLNDRRVSLHPGSKRDRVSGWQCTCNSLTQTLTSVTIKTLGVPLLGMCLPQCIPWIACRKPVARGAF